MLKALQSPADTTIDALKNASICGKIYGKPRVFLHVFYRQTGGIPVQKISSTTSKKQISPKQKMVPTNHLFQNSQRDAFFGKINRTPL
jgi:hypothetical protein